MIADRLPCPSPAGFARWAPAVAVSIAAHGALLGAVLLWEDRTIPPKPPSVFTVDVVMEASLIGARDEPSAEIAPARVGRQSTPADAAPEKPAQTEPETLAVRESSVPPPEVQPASAPADDPAKPVEKAVYAPRPRPKPILDPPPIRKEVRQESAAVQDVTPAAGSAPPVRNARLPEAESAAPRAGSEASSGAAVAGTSDAALRRPRFAAPGRGNPMPKYPRAARRRGLEGTLVLRVEVSADGRPGRISVAQTSGHHLLDEAAIRAVSRWSFEPGRRGGRPVAAAVDVPVEFRLSDGR